MMEVMSKTDMSNVCIYADNSAEISKSLIDGFIDIGIFLSLSEMSPDAGLEVVAEREDEVSWVRSKDFTLSPGAPIPLLTWPGQVTHDLMIQALERKGMIYRIAFSSPDYHARLDAAKAGIGLTLIPKRLVPEPLIVASEYYLPTPAKPRVFLCTRSGATGSDGKFIDELKAKFLGI
jgi:DNA-binding transcriptional LysR family regulator